ncbi:tRNA epoxyqueuosine(34) reductase QueG [Enterococcus timonensis]|uniref:tRNA epoxyqueuosine(34) reductase QueG n=1 Tax=Enterococcus timonensis TaxID=1852364 RepID=UPI0008D9917F|nr:tRNA epoxyqueuosine(34) reductase QueG [Enterococcus timonensis]
MTTSLKEKIIQEAARLGIDKIGFTTAEPFLELKEPIERQRAAGQNSGFEHQNIDERIYLEKTFENPQSIISIALAYPTKIHQEIPKDGKRGQFSRASWGTDYHFILRDKMQQLIQFIQEVAAAEGIENHWRLAPQVDTGELVDVAVAQRAGLGFVGRNGLLITEEFGSWVYLGEIVTNINFEPDAPGVFGCGECTRCIKACPTQAILPEGGLNAQVCLAYQTQTKGMMPEKFRKKISNVIYGCDICQLVCPYNQGKDFHFHEEMEPQVDEVAPLLQPMLTMTNAEFKKNFAHLAGSWRGKKPLQRNAIIALANLHDRSALEELYKVLANDVRPVLRGTAAWAIGQLIRKKSEERETALVYLQAALEVESDDEALAEINQAIEKIK